MYKLKEKPEDFMVNEMMDLNLSEEGKYSYFRLTKKGHNTEDAIRKISDALHIPRNRISYSGAKDRNAFTTQYISAENLNASQRKDIELDNIDLKYVGQGKEPLSLGSHTKNEFIIIVRESDDAPKDNFDSKRVPNLFGPQRFSKNNHIIGKHLIRKEFKKAVNEILTNSGKQEDNVRDYLMDNETDFVGALRTIPKKILSLYVHAYQSKLYNKMVKMHLRRNPDSDNMRLPLIGFTTEPDKYPDYIVDDILDKEEIDTRDFIIKQIPDLSSEGDERNIFMDIDDFTLNKIDDNTYEIRFTLGKGSYATVLIDHLFG